MSLSIIVDAAANQELVAECVSTLIAATSSLEANIIVSAPTALKLAGLGETVKVHSLAGSPGTRLNSAAREADTDFMLFVRPWVVAPEDAIFLMLEALSRDLSIACVAPKLLTPDGQVGATEFILVQDECQRRPINVLLKPPESGRFEPWTLPPSDGVAYKADALMIRKTAFWSIGGWDCGIEGDCMDLSLGLAFKEQLWRCVYVQEAAMITLRPVADSSFSPIQTRELVHRWFGRFLPHALRTADGIMRAHPWWALGAASVPVGRQRASGPFDPLALATDHVRGSIPGERCSVIVVTYNSMESLKACSGSVLEHLGTFDEVIFVDNGSRDDTPRFLKALEESDSRVKVILNNQNLGFSEGCNIGIRASEAEYVVLLNPDTVVIEGWVARMRDYFRDGTVGAVGPISNGVCGLQRYDLHFPRKTPDTVSPGEVHRLVGTVNARRAIESKLLIGFCLMIKRSTLDQIGLLDRDLFLGCDDLDLSWRLRLAGYKLLIATDVFVLHRVHVSFETEPAEVVKALTQRSADAFARKLIAYYGEGQTPSQEELWGIDWFDSQVSVWESAVA